MSSTTSHDPLAELHAQAQSSLDEGDAQAARQVWEAILQIDPEHAGAQAGLHRLDGGTGAAPEFASGDDALRRAAIARAREKISLDRIEEAHGLLQELEEEHPGDPEVAMLLAQTESRMPPPQAFAPASPAGSDIGLDLDVGPRRVRHRERPS
ncbi:MAG: tetratricopeptide repeat protein, partial [Acidobacteria bacterium]|nr:tetratricopeptide repeat protein [Acidobacteriota bacterium]